MANVVKTSTTCAALLAAAILLAAVRLPAHGRFEEPSQPLAYVIHDQCTFSDGSTISFGRKALGLTDPGENVWRTGDFEATALRVSQHTDVGVSMPAGTYTMYVQNTPEDRPDLWTLIISKKAGEWGLAYPGKTYDVGRTRMGSDMLPTPPAVNQFTIGCLQNKDAPIFMWMQSGTRVAYTKVLVETTINGKRERFWH